MIFSETLHPPPSREAPYTLARSALYPISSLKKTAPGGFFVRSRFFCRGSPGKALSRLPKKDIMR